MQPIFEENGYAEKTSYERNKALLKENGQDSIERNIKRGSLEIERGHYDRAVKQDPGH